MPVPFERTLELGTGLALEAAATAVGGPGAGAAVGALELGAAAANDVSDLVDDRDLRMDGTGRHVGSTVLGKRENNELPSIEMPAKRLGFQPSNAKIVGRRPGTRPRVAKRRRTIRSRTSAALIRRYKRRRRYRQRYRQRYSRSRRRRYY